MDRYEMTTRSYVVEVQADSSGTWRGNGLRFPSREEATAYAEDLAYRWTAVRDWRVVDSALMSTHKFVDERVVECSERRVVIKEIVSRNPLWTTAARDTCQLLLDVMDDAQLMDVLMSLRKKAHDYEACGCTYAGDNRWSCGFWEFEEEGAPSYAEELPDTYAGISEPV